MLDLFFLAFVAIINAYVSFKVLYDESTDWVEKALLLSFIWLIPIIGAVITWIAYTQGLLEKLGIGRHGKSNH